MGGDETDEHCLYQKLPSHFLLCGYRLGKTADYVLIHKSLVIFSAYFEAIVIISYFT